MRKSRMLLGALGMIAAIAPAMASGHTKEAVPYEKGLKPTVKEVSPIFGAGTANPHKHQRKGFYNQRQYRKLLRQNPHLRNSKKYK